MPRPMWNSTCRVSGQDRDFEPCLFHPTCHPLLRLRLCRHPRRPQPLLSLVRSTRSHCNSRPRHHVCFSPCVITIATTFLISLRFRCRHQISSSPLDLVAAVVLACRLHRHRHLLCAADNTRSPSTLPITANHFGSTAAPPNVIDKVQVDSGQDSRSTCFNLYRC